MTPLELLDGLVDRFKNELKHFKLKDPNNPELYKEINIFAQHLPHKSKNTDTSLYPYVCIRLSNWGNESFEEPGTTRILFISGVYDNTEGNQGYRDALGLCQKIYESLIRNPIINNRFELVLPINGIYYEEEAFPYFFSAIESHWEIPKPIREDVEHLI